jgi:hypothetical protein
VLPGRLGARFALEALFLVLLAVGAGLADLRPAFIILVIAAGWLLVALAEFTADRIARSPVSYLLPAEPEPKAEAQAEEAEHVFGPPVEERTVVAPPQALEDTQEPVVEPEPVPEPAVTGPEPEPDAEAGAGAEPEPERASDAEAESVELPPRRRLGSLLRRAKTEAEPEPDVPVAAGAWPEAEFEASGQEPEVVPETESRGRFRSFLRRREPEIEPLPEPPPRHVKLLPRRSEPHPDSTEREVAELFDPGDDSVDAEETAG